MASSRIAEPSTQNTEGAIFNGYGTELIQPQGDTKTNQSSNTASTQ
jgi:hypothetical protein